MTEQNKLFQDTTDHHEDVVFGSYVYEDVYKTIGCLYMDYTQQYFKNYTFFPVQNDPEKAKSHHQMIDRYIQICFDFRTTFDVYMKAQFEMVSEYFKSKGYKYLPFPSMISENGIDRFKKYEQRILNRHDRIWEKQKAFYERQQLKITQAVLRSIDVYLDRLKKYDKIDNETALKEFEMLVRQGKISPLYVAIHPLFADRTGFLKTTVKNANKMLNAHQKKSLVNIRKMIDKKFGNKGVYLYV